MPLAFPKSFNLIARSHRFEQEDMLSPSSIHLFALSEKEQPCIYSIFSSLNTIHIIFAVEIKHVHASLDQHHEVRASTPT